MPILFPLAEERSIVDQPFHRQLGDGVDGGQVPVQRGIGAVLTSLLPFISVVLQPLLEDWTVDVRQLGVVARNVNDVLDVRVTLLCVLRTIVPSGQDGLAKEVSIQKTGGFLHSSGIESELELADEVLSLLSQHQTDDAVADLQLF